LLSLLKDTTSAHSLQSTGFEGNVVKDARNLVRFVCLALIVSLGAAQDALAEKKQGKKVETKPRTLVASTTKSKSTKKPQESQASKGKEPKSKASITSRQPKPENNQEKKPTLKVTRKESPKKPSVVKESFPRIPEESASDTSSLASLERTAADLHAAYTKFIRKLPEDSLMTEAMWKGRTRIFGLVMDFSYFVDEAQRNPSRIAGSSGSNQQASASKFTALASKIIALMDLDLTKQDDSVFKILSTEIRSLLPRKRE
jgi:hypothetical protein